MLRVELAADHTTSPAHFLDHVNFDTIACLMFMVDRALSSMRGEEIITGERPSDVSQGE